MTGTKSLITIAIFLYSVLPASSDTTDRTVNPNTITKIDITGNRVTESIIRSMLTFSVGDEIDDSKIRNSKLNLYSLDLFRSLDIRKTPDANSGGTDVVVEARDGWFVLPFPIFGIFGGESYYGAGAIEQNVFREAEHVTAYSDFKKDEYEDMLTISLPDITLNARLEKKSYTEYQYSNGGFNSHSFTGSELNNLGRYGQVVNSYNENSTAMHLSVEKLLSDQFRGILGVKVQDVGYTSAQVSAPGDNGRITVLSAAMRFGSPFSYVRNAANVAGRIFGLGMADLEESMKPPSCMYTDYGLRASFDTSSTSIGSENNFNKFSLAANSITHFCDMSSISFLARGRIGNDIPASQLFATNHEEGLTGAYSREFRGDKMVLATAAWTRPFYHDGTGQLAGTLFCDYAASYLNGQQGIKEGTGFILTYRLWRIPLPFGFGYTYCLDDSEWLASISLGGAF
jgi:outer membrane protein assembly factor BamA